MAHHLLKTWPGAWHAVNDGRKRFEWRKDDRGFEVGDLLSLLLYDPQKDAGAASIAWEHRVQNGQQPVLRVEVTYILRGQFGVPPDYCVLGIKPQGAP